MKWRIGLRKATARATKKKVEWSPSTGTDAIREITEAVQHFLMGRLARLGVNPDLKTAKTLCLQFTFQLQSAQEPCENEPSNSELPLFPREQTGPTTIQKPTRRSVRKGTSGKRPLKG